MRVMLPTRWALGVLLLFVLVLVPASFADEPVTAQSLMDTAWAKYQAGDLTNAKALWLKVLADYPKSEQAPEAQLKLGYLQIKQAAASDQAIAEFQKVIDQFPDSKQIGEARYRIGYLHIRERRFDDAIASLREAVKSRKLERNRQADAATQIGFTYIMKYWQRREVAHLDPAATELQAVLKDYSDVLGIPARAELGLGEIGILRGKPEEARKHYQSALDKSGAMPRYAAIARYGLACCANVQGDLPNAITAFQAFLDSLAGKSLLDKDKAWKNVCLSALSENMQALVQADKAWQRIPASAIVPKAAYYEAEALHLSGDDAKASILLAEVVNAFPKEAISQKAQTLLAKCQGE